MGGFTVPTWSKLSCTSLKIYLLHMLPQLHCKRSNASSEAMDIAVCQVIVLNMSVQVINVSK